MSLCIVGGASLAHRYPSRRIVAFDNLSRRGSELNLATFRAHYPAWQCEYNIERIMRATQERSSASEWP